jgi:hypothetical protein
VIDVVLDQQHLVAIVEQFLGDRPTDRPGTGDADAHHLPLIRAVSIL